MIVRPRPSVFGLLFIVRGSIVPTIAGRLLAVFLLSAAVAGVHAAMPQRLPELTVAPLTLFGLALFGLALSIFLGFRNNACYERWWEGRRQWGQLIAESRILVRDIGVLLPDEPGLKRRCGRRIVAFAHALRHQLRGTGRADAAAWLDPDEWAYVEALRSQPDGIMLAFAGDLRTLVQQHALSDIAYHLFSERLAAITTIQTACERLRATPPPFAYSLLLHRTAWLFCLVIPFCLVGAIGFLTPLLTVVLAYTFFGLDALGDQLEEPFGETHNALPLDAMVRAIEIATLEGMGETDLPEPLLPRDYVLL